MSPKLGLPKVCYLSFYESLVTFLGLWLSEKYEGVGEIVLETEVSNIGKPILKRLGGACQHFFRKSMQDVARKTTQNAKEGKLLLVEFSLSW